MPSFKDLNAQLLAVDWAQFLFPNAKRHGQSLRIGDLDGNQGASLWICLRTGQWKDHATGEGGKDLISLYAAMNSLSQSGARRLLENNGCSQSITKLKATKPLQMVAYKSNDYALSLWSSSIPAKDTATEIYLRSRGITSPIPSDIRTVPLHKHSYSGNFFPVMLTAIRHPNTGRVSSVHRTWLKHDGSCKADIEPNKMMLGSLCGGGAQLFKSAPKMIVSEGIENALSVTQATGLPSWAGLSTSGITNLLLPAPPLAEEIIIACDNDPPGIKAAKKAAKKWIKEGRKVSLALPPLNQDFNDLLIRK